MKSRERVLKATNHQEPDRIPIDFGGHRSSGIMAIAYARLKEELDIKSGNIYVYDIFGGDDLGTNNGPIISPEMYREFVKPYHKRLWNQVKKQADVKVQLHCCGGIEPLLNDMIDAGLDIVNPVQISARGMNSEGLISKYGNSICFWGSGCDTQHVLDRATPEELEKHVTDLIDVWKKNNGYVFQQVHNIMANVPPKNIVRLFETMDKIR